MNYSHVLKTAFFDELEKIAKASSLNRGGMSLSSMQKQMMRTPKVPLQAQLPSQTSANIPQPAPPPQTSSLSTNPLVGM